MPKNAIPRVLRGDNYLSFRKDHQIYTRYVYNGEVFRTGEWDIDDQDKINEGIQYYLYRNGCSIPNVGKTTRFMESVIVTFAADNKTIYLSENETKTGITSKITIS